MRVLWFSINSSLYISRNGAKAGHGGWIGSLEHIVRQHDDFQLGIAFESKENIFKYNPQNEMFAHFQTKRIIFKNETQLFKVIPIPQKSQKNRPASPEFYTFEGS